MSWLQEPIFPTISVVYPNDEAGATLPTCGLNQGSSVGWLSFHIPLTQSVGTSALYFERFPGREDWHPVEGTFADYNTGVAHFFV